jgi:regulator of replication initiation timing
MAQMQSYIAQLENQVKKLSGDLQTADREMVNARKRVETEKFKSRLNEVIQDTKVKERGKLQDLGRAIDNMSDDEG